MPPLEPDKLFARAHLLALLTIGYNLVEGIVSMALGVADETLVLFGFGVDSFIEVLSAVGVVMCMLLQLQPSFLHCPANNLVQQLLRPVCAQ